MMRKPFKVIPVLDLKNGMVVGGHKGERHKYQPVKSMLTSSKEFADVMEAFSQHLGLREFYVADLDALMSSGKKDQLGLIAAVKKNMAFPYSIMLDAGIRDSESIAKVLKTGVEKIIIGTETLISLDTLPEIINKFGAQQLVVSIDTKESGVISSSSEIAQLSPPEVIKEVRKTGIDQFILLQLSRVGTGEGVDKKLIQECVRALIKDKSSGGSLILGGGVSGYEDLKWLAQNGVEGALVATSLHEGRLNREAIEKLNDLER
ncbi:MAG: hypothetical protein GX434_05535 [Peptococcaceae bacterium]|nr:hypothetical protein [Peptococcaceae bacterium]